MAFLMHILFKFWSFTATIGQLIHALKGY